MKNYRKPYRIKKKKPIYKNRFFWLSIVITLIFIGIFYSLFVASFFQIKEIKISGNNEIPEGSIFSVVQGQTEKNLLFFPTRSIFLVNLAKTKEQILNDFPKITRAEIERKFPNILNVKIEEREELVALYQAEKCFLLDKGGVSFEYCPESTTTLPKIKISTSTSEKKLGEEALKEEDVANILKISLKLKELEIPMKEFLIISEERINVLTSGGWEIYFSQKSDIDWQLTKLGVVLEKEIPLAKRGDLEYIELRFGNLAPYKYY
jgi:hypothetical protein